MSSEIDTLHIPFKQWLEDAGICYTYHRPDRPTGATLGDADFMIHRNGRCLMVEFKDKNTAVSESQIDRHAELLRHGCEVFIVRELERARVLVVQWLSAMDLPIEPRVDRAASLVCRFNGNIFKRQSAKQGAGWSFVRKEVLDDLALPTMAECK